MASAAVLRLTGLDAPIRRSVEWSSGFRVSGCAPSEDLIPNARNAEPETQQMFDETCEPMNRSEPCGRAAPQV